jgi:hypothetical protein
MGWILHSSTYYQTRVSSYGYIPSCQEPKAAASQGSERAMLIRCGQPLAMPDRWPGSTPRVGEKDGRVRQVAKSHLPALIIRWRSDGVDHFRD